MWNEQISSNNSLAYCGAYVIKHLSSGKMYVGSTSNLRSRRIAHETLLKRNEHYNAELQEAFNEFPDLEFVSILTNNREEAFDREQEVLDQFGKKGMLYNVALDTRRGRLGQKFSEETKKRMSEAHLGKRNSLETLAKMRQAKLGKVCSEKHRQNLLASKQKLAKKVEIDGIVYGSRRLAAEQLEISADLVRYRIVSASPQFTSWKYVLSE